MVSIYQSTMFKGSKYKKKIEASIKNPINQPLVQQIDPYVEDVTVDDVSIEVDEPAAPEFNNSRSSLGGFRGGSGSFSGDFTDEEFEDEEGLDDGELSEGFEELPNDESDIEEVDENIDESEIVEESSKVTKSPINAGTYVTVQNVADAVNEIPSMLNLSEDTCGVTQAILKGGSTNEIWVYYDSNVDVNSKLDKINQRIALSGYYFLEFMRFNRDEHAVVFSINWVSNYFNPLLAESKDSE